MKDLIKEVALSVANEMNTYCKTDYDEYKHCCFEFSESELTEFATAFLAELSKRAEAVAYYEKSDQYDAWFLAYSCDLTKEHKPLFTFPPIHDIEAIENRVAEACAKACIKEAVQIVIDGPEERAYNNATSDCAEAIRSGEWRKYK